MSMTLPRIAALTFQSLRHDKRSAVLSCFGTAVGIAALAFFIALGHGLGDTVRSRIFPQDVGAVEVIPSSVSIGGLLGGQKLDEQAFARLSAIEGVRQAYRKMEVRVPAMATPAAALADGFRVPKNIRVALIAVGVEKSFVQVDLKGDGKAFDLGSLVPAPKEGAAGPGAVASPDPVPSLPWDSIPAMASRRLLALYNQAFAKSQGLPSVSPSLLDAAAGTTLVDVHLGRSMSGGRQMAYGATHLSFAGLTERAPLHGVLIPLEAAKAINELYGQDSETFSAVTLMVDSPSMIPAVRGQVRQMGFSIDEGERELSEKIGQGVALTTAAMAFLSILICLVAAVNIAHALLADSRVREREFALFRALGATRLDVGMLVVAKAFAIGLAGGVAGLLAAWSAGRVLIGFLAGHVPDLPFEADCLFNLSPALMAAGLAVAVASALAGAAFPALMASRVSPARVLAG